MIITRSKHWSSVEDEALYHTARNNFGKLKSHNEKIMLQSDLAKKIFEDFCVRVNNRPCKIPADVMYRLSKYKLIYPRVPIKSEGYVFNTESMIDRFDVPPPSYGTFSSNLKRSASDLECALNTLKFALSSIGSPDGAPNVNRALSESLPKLKSSLKDAHVLIELTKLNLLFTCIEYKLIHLDDSRSVVVNV
ncbi:hypothetical protein VCHA53O466_50169 [Vibrio chagasii]|nr:hypothetical protein VCHA53O466_50169 [Vibrio chagasii]